MIHYPKEEDLPAIGVIQNWTESAKSVTYKVIQEINLPNTITSRLTLISTQWQAHHLADGVF